MKKNTMIFIDKLQKHIKNKIYMIWVEWDFKISKGPFDYQLSII